MTHEQDEQARPGSAPTATLSGRVDARVRRVMTFGAGVVAALLALLAYGSLQSPTEPITERDIEDSVARVLSSQEPGPPLSALIYQVVQPSLVLVRVERATDTEPSGTEPSDTEPVAPASPGPGSLPRGESDTTLGTAVVIDDAANVLTALHVVDDATSIELTFADGTVTLASITNARPQDDIALLTPHELPSVVVPAVLGNAAGLRVGSEAFIVGHPFGMYGSMSAGIVSGLDRSFRVPNADRVLHGLIQVDAAVNPGNSGGPLVDRAGHLTGIVTALVNPTEQEVFIGIGLAVPIDIAGGAAGAPAY